MTPIKAPKYLEHFLSLLFLICSYLLGSSFSFLQAFAKHRKEQQTLIFCLLSVTSFTVERVCVCVRECGRPHSSVPMLVEARLANEALGFFCSDSQHWGYRHRLPYWAFSWVLGI